MYAWQRILAITLGIVGVVFAFYCLILLTVIVVAKKKKALHDICNDSIVYTIRLVAKETYKNFIHNAKKTAVAIQVDNGKYLKMVLDRSKNLFSTEEIKYLNKKYGKYADLWITENIESYLLEVETAKEKEVVTDKKDQIKQTRK